MCRRTACRTRLPPPARRDQSRRRSLSALRRRRSQAGMKAVRIVCLAGGPSGWRTYAIRPLDEHSSADRLCTLRAVPRCGPGSLSHWAERFIVVCMYMSACSVAVEYLARSAVTVTVSVAERRRQTVTDHRIVCSSRFESVSTALHDSAWKWLSIYNISSGNRLDCVSSKLHRRSQDFVWGALFLAKKS